MTASTLYNRVAFGAKGKGTGSFVVGPGNSGVIQGYLRPADASIPDNTLVSYTAISPASSTAQEWETGQGTYTVANTTLARTTVRESSAGGAKVDFSQAPMVWLDMHAQDLLF